MTIDRTLYLVRHGHRLDEINKRWYEATDANRYDSPLSPEGEAQADKLAQRLSDEPIDWVFSSPYLRALQTAHPVAQALDLPLYVEHGVGEWLGKAMMSTEPQITPIYQRLEQFPALDVTHNPRVIPHYPESVAQCFERLERAITQLLDAYGGNLLIIGHGRTVTGIAHRLTGQPESNFKLANAGITKLDHVDGRWVVRLNSDTAHLTAQAVPQFV